MRNHLLRLALLPFVLCGLTSCGWWSDDAEPWRPSGSFFGWKKAKDPEVVERASVAPAPTSAPAPVPKPAVKPAAAKPAKKAAPSSSPDSVMGLAERELARRKHQLKGADAAAMKAAEKLREGDYEGAKRAFLEAYQKVPQSQ